MQSGAIPWTFESLLSGRDPGGLARWIRAWNRRSCWWILLLVVVGAGLFGAALGSWRSPLQAVYAAVKLPLILLLTAFGNAVANAVLAPLLGLQIGFRESLAAVLTSCAISATILGSAAPLIAFLVWSSPPLGGPQSGTGHSLVLLSTVLSLAACGIVGNLRLFQTLLGLSGDRRAALRVLVAWLGMNLLLGSQFSWLARPFIGSPGLPVEFLRPEAFHGNFFESVYLTVKHLLFA